MVFHNWGATVENARPPYVLDFMAGVDNSERDDDLSALDGWYVLIRGSRYPADCPVWCLVRWSPSARISSKSFLPLHISSYKRVLMGLTDRRKKAKKLVDSRKNWKVLTVNRK